MSRPHVVTHVLLSVDGRLEGFPPDVALYYELAGRLPHDVVLAGSGTMVAAAAEAGVDLTEDDDAAPADASPQDSPTGPLLVVVDSRGQLTRFAWLRATGFWRDVVILGSDTTPPAHRERLQAGNVKLEVAGDDRVDLRAALRHLMDSYGVEAVRVDAGPRLNAALLRAGLMDEVSVLIAPYLVGEGRTFLDQLAGEPRPQLELNGAEPQRDGHVWLRYTVLYP